SGSVKVVSGAASKDEIDSIVHCVGTAATVKEKPSGNAPAVPRRADLCPLGLRRGTLPPPVNADATRSWDEGALAMRHEDAFLLAVLEDREDDTPRRVFADWLLDQPGAAEAARGELIHIQCDLARLPEGTLRPEAIVRRE